MSKTQRQKKIFSPTRGDGAVAEQTGRENIPPEHGLSIRRPKTVHIIPQAHIDLLWYWSPSEGIRMILHTFRGHVEKLESNPDYTYAQSQAYAYEVVLREEPDLFARIQKLVAKGQWELVGGEWVEADPVLPGPEARVRQYLLGQRFFRKHFGKPSLVGWCPDGFTVTPGSLPQILRQSGMKYFVHKRPREKCSRLPITPYRWRSPDGSEVIALRMNNKGNGLPKLSEGDASPATMGDLSVIATAFEEINVDQLFGPMGVGDIGGVNSYLLPETSSWFTCRYSTPTAWFEAVMQQVEPGALPEVTGSFTQVMTGALTTWASIKTLNRRAETTLQTAEFVIALAETFGLDVDADILVPPWKELLFWQFHDSVTGCGTEDILPIVEHGYRKAIVETERELTRRTRQIAESLMVDFEAGLPVTVFNPLGEPRSEMISARITLPREWLKSSDLVPTDQEDAQWFRVDIREHLPESKIALEAVDAAGNVTPVMLHQYAQLQKKFTADVRFLATHLPPMGYKTFTLRRGVRNDAAGASVNGSHGKTDKLNVTFDFENGGIKLLNVNDVEITAKDVLGQLAIHHTGKYELDYGREYRAWYTGFLGRMDVLKPTSHTVRHYSGQRTGIVFEYAYNNSTFKQEFLIEPGADFIEVTLHGDWREIEKYLKIHFDLQNQGKANAFADLPYGFTGQLPEGEEYAMQYVAGIHDDKTILAIANNSRYGCLWKDGSLSLSAVRCATWPARVSDRGDFEMTYRITAFAAGDGWKRRAVSFGYSLNLLPCTYAQEYSGNQHPANGSLLEAGVTKTMITCLKPAEDGDGLILRLFNPSDKAVEESFRIPAEYSRAIQTNLLEEPLPDSIDHTGSVELMFRPWEIKTLLFKKG